MTGIWASTPYPDPCRNPRTAGHWAEELTPIHPDPCSNPHTAGGQAQYSDPFLPNPRTDPRTAAHRANTAQMPLPDPHSPKSTATVTDTALLPHPRTDPCTAGHWAHMLLPQQCHSCAASLSQHSLCLVPLSALRRRRKFGANTHWAAVKDTV